MGCGIFYSGPKSAPTTTERGSTSTSKESSNMSLGKTTGQNFQKVITEFREIQSKKGAETTKTEKGSTTGEVDRPSSPKASREEGAQVLPRPSNGLRRFTAVAVGAGTVLRALVAVGTVGISEGLLALGKKIGDAYAGRTAAPKADFKLTDPASGKEITAKSSMGPSKVPKGTTTEQIARDLQAKVNAGHDLMQRVSAGTHKAPCTVEDMTNIMFALQVRGEAQKGSFKDGAFNISDPGQNIRRFLDGCPQSYQRESSHIGAFQKMGAGKHRGIDAYGNGDKMSEMLPHGMKTLLYGSIPQSDKLKMPEDRLYLKIESHGAWLTKPKGGRDAEGPSRTGNHHDIGAILGHSLSFIATRGQGSAGGTFKERIPDSVKNEFKAIMKQAPEDLRATLGDSGPLETAGGLRIMHDNAVKARASMPDKTPLRDRLDTFIADLNKNFDRLDVRIGNEVII